MNKLSALFIVFALLCSLYSCQKVDNYYPEDNKKTNIEIQGVEYINENQLNFVANVLYSNTKNVEDYGFIVNPYSADSVRKKYSLGSNLASGRVSYALKQNSSSLIKEGFTFSFYVQSADSTLMTPPYYVSPIREELFRVHPEQSFSHYVGEDVVIKGDFRRLTQDYILCLGENAQPIPFTISSDKARLTFKFVDDGSESNYFLSSKQKPTDFKWYLAKVHTIAQLAPPESYNISWYKYLNLSALSGNPYSTSIIIGNKLVRYEPYLQLDKHINYLNGDQYRLGYFNGRDTVIFPHKLQISVEVVDVFIKLKIGFIANQFVADDNTCTVGVA